MGPQADVSNACAVYAVCLQLCQGRRRARGRLPTGTQRRIGYQAQEGGAATFS